MSAYFKMKTVDGTEVIVRKEHVSAIEEIPGSTRSEPFLKLYINGYSFKIKKDKEELCKELNIDLNTI